MFFSFDGIDGGGKSTQARLLAERLMTAGYEVVTCRDPGSTELGESVRQLLLESDASTPIGRRSEMLLYMAARAQMVDQIVRPALDAGRIVVSDRYVLASIVYQGHAGGLDPQVVSQVAAIATGGIMPDCVFVLDVPFDEADRRFDRPLDRMEQQGEAYRIRLRDGFLAEAARDAERTHVIDGSRSIEAVHADVWQIASRFLAS